MLDRCRLAPLTAAYALADIPPQNRLPEMGFTLYMEDFGLERLRAWFARPNSGLPPECAEAARMLDFKDVQGFLSGFIDMVYQDSDGLVCIIDYKSNHLGNNAEAYTPQAMNEAMAHHHYYLQALISPSPSPVTTHFAAAPCRESPSATFSCAGWTAGKTASGAGT